MNLKHTWLYTIVLILFSLGGYLYYFQHTHTRVPLPTPRFTKRSLTHLDHSAFFKAEFSSPQEVTKACLRCHPQAAADFMKTAHWQWLGPEETIPGRSHPTRIGKRNLLNNFCIGIQGNWAACTKCHAGYGWERADFDFSEQENVDCLVCHDGSDSYIKGNAGLPAKGVSLLAAARSVGYPRRENCGTCHYYGGGGMGVKHGDLDDSLDNPAPDVDVHMGKNGFLCIDCHRTEKHRIPGRSFSVSAVDAGGMNCEECHGTLPHRDARLNRHTARVACATCHIPAFARQEPTKMFWDWSKAGDSKRAEDPHHYLKIKGEFVYENNVQPEYYWFNLSVNRYLLGDKVPSAAVIDINHPIGSRDDPKAKIWPFKVHRAKQPYDPVNGYLLPVVTAGEGGYWHEFNWDKALTLGERISGLPYSGKYTFAETRMFWPLSHGVVGNDQALTCNDCHNSGSRLNWQALGYDADPMGRGGRQ